MSGSLAGSLCQAGQWRCQPGHRSLLQGHWPCKVAGPFSNSANCPVGGAVASTPAELKPLPLVGPGPALPRTRGQSLALQLAQEAGAYRLPRPGLPGSPVSLGMIHYLIHSHHYSSCLLSTYCVPGALTLLHFTRNSQEAPGLGLITPTLLI